MALGIGYGLPFYPHFGSGADPYKPLWNEALEGAKGAGATVEDEGGTCLVVRGSEVYNGGLPSTPSLLIVPQFYKDGNLYQDVPPFVAEDLTMRFTVSRNTTATRVDSNGLIASVASGVPRIDWLGQSCPALLVEASGQNLFLQSAGFEVSGNWETSNITVTTGSTAAFTAPDGSTDADLITATASGSSVIRQNITIASGTYTISVFAKAGNYGLFRIGNVSSTARAAWFNLDAGAVTGTVNGGTASMQNYGNGWYRCIYTSPTMASGLTFFAPSDAPNSTNAVSGSSIYFWGAQLEVGSVATTYIPTTTTTASRAADVISASGALVSGLIGQTEGTIYAEVDVRTLGAAKNIMQIDEGASTNRIGLFVDISPTRLTLLMSNGGVTNSISGSLTTGITKIAASYSSGDVQVFTNGSFLVSGTIATYPTATLNSISVGSRISSGVYGIQLNDRIRAAALYTTRLSNDQLAELTRL